MTQDYCICPCGKDSKSGAEAKRKLEAAEKLLAACYLIQRIAVGSFAEGWTSHLSGHQMKAVTEAIEAYERGL